MLTALTRVRPIVTLAVVALRLRREIVRARVRCRRWEHAICVSPSLVLVRRCRVCSLTSAVLILPTRPLVRLGLTIFKSRLPPIPLLTVIDSAPNRLSIRVFMLIPCSVLSPLAVSMSRRKLLGCITSARQAGMGVPRTSYNATSLVTITISVTMQCPPMAPCPPTNTSNILHVNLGYQS